MGISTDSTLPGGIPPPFFYHGHFRRTESLVTLQLFIMRLLDRYKDFYGTGCCGMPLSTEELQALALESMVKAFARKYNLRDTIPVAEILALAESIRGHEAL